MTEWPEPVARVAAVIRATAIAATIQEFPQGTPTAELAADAVGCRLDQIVKTLVFVCDGEYVLALIPGDRRADERKVAAEVGARGVRVARADEVLEATGFDPGAVAPFPRGDAIAILIERTLLQHPQVWIGAGSTRHMAAISPGDLQTVSGARGADLVASAG